MWWRIGAKDWDQAAGAGNRKSFRRVAQTGPAPGLVAYHQGQAGGLGRGGAT